MAIVKDFDEIKKIVTMNSDVRMQHVMPYIEDVEQEFILPILGNTFYTAMEGKNRYTGQEQKLFEHITNAVVPLALYIGTDSINVGISSQGLVVTKDDESAPASEVRAEKFKRSNMNLGHRRLNRLIQFVVANIDDFGDLDKAEWDATQPVFMTGLKEFNSYADIGNNYFIYLKMCPIMQRIENRILNNYLGDALFTYVKSNLGDANVKNLLPYINEVTANKAFEKSIEELALNIDERGVTIFNNNYAETVNVRQPIKANRMAELKKSKASAAQDAVDALLNYLQINVGTFSDYESSAFYIAPSTDTSDDPLPGTVVSFDGGTML